MYGCDKCVLPSKSGQRSHAAKKAKRTDAQLDRDLEAVIQAPRDGWTHAKTRSDWPETWDKLIKGWWHSLEKRRGGGWYHGVSRRQKDSDSIMRSSWFPTWEAAAAFAEKWV